VRAKEFINESFGLNYPQTWDETNKPFIKKGQRRTGNLTEETTTLNQIYRYGLPDDDELIWQYIGTNDLTSKLEIKRMIPGVLKQMLEIQYGVEDIEDLLDRLEPEQVETLNNYKNTDLSNEIIVVYDGKIVDGNHRALAASLMNTPIKYVDLSDLDDEKQLDEKWSNKYKRSINCNNPKGFSQRAHCQGRKK
jgi:hypothetical protein